MNFVNINKLFKTIKIKLDAEREKDILENISSFSCGHDIVFFMHDVKDLKPIEADIFNISNYSTDSIDNEKSLQVSDLKILNVNFLDGYFSVPKIMDGE